MYRSKLESLVAGLLGPTWEYEPFKMPYTVHRNYNPDFVKGDIMIEVKGFFRVGDTAKYKAIRDACLFKELVFFLQAPKTKIRKGAKMNMGQWCEKEGIKWFDDVEKLKEYADNGHF
jgi:hypothetical protein